MIKIYKYMSEKAAISFIKNQMIRITPAWSLNDPFECKLSNSTCKQLNSIGGNFMRSHLLEDFMDRHGIVSLTETPDNLLMWSHYADEHKGVVVEFIIDENDPFEMFNTTHIPKSSDAVFKKVNYRKLRNYPFTVNEQNFKSIRDHYYLTKSDEWIYEKEHRFIFPATALVGVIPNENHDKRNMTYEHLGVCHDKDDLSLINALHPENITRAWKSSRDTEAMFFVPINSRKIGRIIIGCNADLNRYKEVMIEAEKNESNRKFACSIFNEFIGVEVAKLHPDKFELSFESLKDKVN
ncbi:DUF2971 domain-containing protein [Vibrio jasicida]|uniref:DUF2971 domain-containing protein n=1 Tax=Vibrio jasicida TaxID=766224 RepID=UPI000CE3D056|nr:DUF2971 domain-containing protein [Vibrio jasicida]